MPCRPKPIPPELIELATDLYATGRYESRAAALEAAEGQLSRERAKRQAADRERPEPREVSFPDDA